MSTITEVSIDAGTFALGVTLETIPEATFDIERVVAHSPESVLPFVWATAPDREVLEAALEDDPSVAEVTLLSDLEDEWLYRMEWIAHVQFVVHAIVEEQATVLDAHTKDGGWGLRILFPDRESLSRTYEFCEDHDIEVDVETIYEVDHQRHGRFGLTEGQTETLLAAFEAGYYEVPRDASVADLAEDLGISHQALSERFRRAHGNLVENTLIIGRENKTRSKPAPEL